MAKIKVKRGGCGIKYTDANGTERHALKTPENGPFECDDAQAARLVGLGVAEYVGACAHQEVEPAPQPDNQEEPDADAQEPEKMIGHLDAAELEKWNYNDLKALAADMGVKPNGTKKADYIAALVAAEVELDEADMVDLDPDDLDELPDLNAADPE